MNETESAMLRRDVEELTKKVDVLSEEVKNLVAAWQTASGIVAFVKWLAGGVTAWILLGDTIKGFFK
jgi:hypothetical protein